MATNNIQHSELSVREAQLALTKREMKLKTGSEEGEGDSSIGSLGYWVKAAMYQANATIASVLQSQFPKSTVEPGRLPHQESEHALGSELGLEAEAGVETHPALADSVQHDGIAPDNNRETTITPEMLQTLPVHELTPELQNKLAKQQSPTHIPAPSPLK